MSRNVATCKADDRLDAAVRLMWDLDIGCVPIVDDQGHVVGIITDRDVCMATYTQGKAPQHVFVREAMAREVYSCLPDDNLAEAEEIMRKRRVRRIPVIDLDGRLVGARGAHDIVQRNDADRMSRSSISRLQLRNLWRRARSRRRRNGTLIAMCDTLAIVQDGVVWFAKNSDREPGESQVVEHRPRERHPEGARVRATYLELDQAAETHEVVLSRPTWMWGAEMGANAYGLAIGNEAVFTHVPVEDTGLLGMDLVRLALERCKTADEALDLIAWLLARYGQGGAAGFRNRGMSYHNAFVIADPHGAWIMETAGRFWAAERVRGARTISNVLTIGADYARVGPGTIEGARSLGLLARGEWFDFRRCFGQQTLGWLSGGDRRRACTLGAIANLRGDAGFEVLAGAVRDHAGRKPEEGARIIMPCAHASWLPTRGAGQTTGTMISRLEAGGSRHWLTGTSAPCLSVLKPVPLGGALVDTGPVPSKAGFDATSLFWRAERLHRIVLRDYDARRATFEDARRTLEVRARRATSVAEASDAWRDHNDRVAAWAQRAAGVRAPRRPRAFDLWWRVQSWKDSVPT